MNHYTVYLRASVLAHVSVQADSEDEAERLACEQVTEYRDRVTFDVDDFDVDDVIDRGPVLP